ncbi:MAG: hypothetical protein ABI999_00520 [Acidobacteriota bacterium]
MSLEVAALYERAKVGAMNIATFFEELQKLGIEGFVQAMHAANAFEITLNEAKEHYIECQDGGVDAWASQFDEVDFNFDPDPKAFK